MEGAISKQLRTRKQAEYFAGFKKHTAFTSLNMNEKAIDFRASNEIFSKNKWEDHKVIDFLTRARSDALDDKLSARNRNKKIIEGNYTRNTGTKSKKNPNKRKLTTTFTITEPETSGEAPKKTCTDNQLSSKKLINATPHMVEQQPGSTPLNNKRTRDVEQELLEDNGPAPKRKPGRPRKTPARQSGAKRSADDAQVIQEQTEKTAKQSKYVALTNDERAAEYESPFHYEETRPQFDTEPMETSIPDDVIYYLQIMYEDSLCERCREAGTASIEDRAHILVECPSNREETIKLQRRILRTINKHIHYPENSFPNWFALYDNEECGNTEKDRKDISRWPKLAGMLGWIPLSVTQWFNGLYYKPKWNTKKILAKINRLIVQHARRMFDARNKHWKGIRQHVFPDVKWVKGKMKRRGKKCRVGVGGGR